MQAYDKLDSEVPMVVLEATETLFYAIPYHNVSLITLHHEDLMERITILAGEAEHTISGTQLRELYKGLALHHVTTVRVDPAAKAGAKVTEISVQHA